MKDIQRGKIDESSNKPQQSDQGDCNREHGRNSQVGNAVVHIGLWIQFPNDRAEHEDVQFYVPSYRRNAPYVPTHGSVLKVELTSSNYIQKGWIELWNRPYDFPHTMTNNKHLLS